MTLSKSLCVLLLTSGVTYASTLAVYQDKTFYNYTPQHNFIGFSQGLSAKCEGTTMALSTMSECPEDEKLCKEFTAIENVEKKLQSTVANTKVLAQLISLPQPTSFDASSWIESAKLIGEEQSKLLTQERTLKKESLRLQRAFKKKAPTKDAIQTDKICKSELELTIPYGYVSFSTKYEANIVDEKEITVTQNLSILNRSGVDIVVDTAMFYYRSAHQYVRPVHFNPWIVSKYVPKPKKMYKTARVQAAPMMEMAMVSNDEIGGDIVPSAPVASYEDAREYKIQNLTLPSTGVPLDVKVMSWKAALNCEVRAYPYVNRKAFTVCSFKPKYQIDSNSWKVTSGTEVINENAIGEYRKGTYNLYTKVEEDIKIIRNPIVQKERETGIFGGTARKKDGFTLTLTNKSDKEKTLTVIERIPTSTTEEIKAKLLSINSAKKVNYKMLKDGEIEMKISLAGNESKKIEVLFEISYDKELKVNY